MQRKLIHGFLAALLLVMQLCTLVGIRHVQAVESPSVQETLIDSNDLKLEVNGVQNGQTVDWTVKYERKASTNARALKLNVKAADTLLAPKDAKTWQELQATNTKWWQEKDFSTKASGVLRYQTSIEQLSLAITAQLDEQQPVVEETVKPVEGETAETATKTVETPKTPTVTTDLLDAKVAGPHTITLVLPEPEVDEPVPDPDDQTAQDNATDESVVDGTLPVAPTPDEAEKTEDPIADESEPVVDEETTEEPAVDEEEATTVEDADTDTEATATDEADADADADKTEEEETEEPADEPKTKAAEDKVIEPNTDLPQAQATNLVLQQYQFATLAIESKTGDIVFKKPSGTQNYDSENNMRKYTSKNYTAGSSSGAVIFETHDEAKAATINLSYDDVGYVQLAGGGSARIGARVTVSGLTHRSSDWGTNGKMAMDFSDNFYSGLQLANVRQFDWKVTFFVKDTHAVVNFAADSTAMLTFTSLNPGEFVKPPAGLTFSTSDADSVKLTKLGSQTNPPGNYDAYQTWLKNGGWPTTDGYTIEAYTAQKWGEWEDDKYKDGPTMWQDKLGAPTFANGAAAFTLKGSTFTFKRGTYFSGNTTWLANSSSNPIITMPKDMENNKSISKDAVDGGGNSQDIHNTPADAKSWTPNDLDGKNINAQAQAGSEMYYYINQQTYSLSGEALAFPKTITITDDLPVGMEFYSNSNDDVVVFNERKSGETEGMILEGAEIKRTGQNLTVTLPENVVKKIPFDGGYLTIRIRVKTNHDPNTITQAYKMDNTATVTITADGVDPYVDPTNTVTVNVIPNVDAEFQKVDDDGNPLEEILFRLFDNSEATGSSKYFATSDTDGKVKFKNVIPGVYWLKESGAGNAYRPLTGTIRITINQDGSITWPEDWKHGNKVVNEKKTWNIHLKKIDPDGNTLSGAEFTLFDKDDNKIAVGTSDSDGMINLVDIKLDLETDYVLKETKAPLGFKLIPEGFSFVITVNGWPTGYLPDEFTDFKVESGTNSNTISFTITNNYDDPIDLPVTGGNGTQAIIAASIVIMMMAGMLGWHWRKEAHR